MATDVLNDPRYLMTLMQRSPHDPLRQMAEKRLEYLQHQDALDESTASREQIAAANRQQRQDALDLRRETVSEAERGRTERAGALRQLQQTAEQDRKSQGLIAAMNASQ